MNILVTAATELELKPFMENHPTATCLITGVGMHNVVYHLGKKLSLDKFDFVFQVGVAGGFSTCNTLGESVLVSKDCFADIGAFENGTFQNMFDMKLADPDNPPFNHGWLKNKFTNSNFLSYKKVTAITINSIQQIASVNQCMEEKYDADIETMEGAAFHFVCLQEKIPFLQIRGISNLVGERDKSKWDIQKAIVSSNKMLSDILPLIAQNNINQSW